MLVYDAKPYDRTFFEARRRDYEWLGVELAFTTVRLSEDTVALANGAEIVCVFVNDDLNANVVARLRSLGVGLILLRCAGFNNVDLAACRLHEVSVARVPAYSPNAVAEHAMALILALARKINHAYNRTRNGDFSLSHMLLGFDRELTYSAVNVLYS